MKLFEIISNLLVFKPTHFFENLDSNIQRIQPSGSYTLIETMHSISVKFILIFCALVLLISCSEQKSLKRTVRETTSDDLQRVKLLNMLLRPEIRHIRRNENKENEILAKILVI